MKTNLWLPGRGVQAGAVVIKVELDFYDVSELLANLIRILPLAPLYSAGQLDQSLPC